MMLSNHKGPNCRKGTDWQKILLATALLSWSAALPAQSHSGDFPPYQLAHDWPQLPLGDHWLTGGIGGMCIDSRDHVFLLNRQNVVEEDLDAARPAPPIIELNPEGVVVRGWGARICSVIICMIAMWTHRAISGS